MSTGRIRRGDHALRFLREARQRIEATGAPVNEWTLDAYLAGYLAARSARRVVSRTVHIRPGQRQPTRPGPARP